MVFFAYGILCYLSSVFVVFQSQYEKLHPTHFSTFSLFHNFWEQMSPGYFLSCKTSKFLMPTSMLLSAFSMTCNNKTRVDHFYLYEIGVIVGGIQLLE